MSERFKIFIDPLTGDVKLIPIPNLDVILTQDLDFHVLVDDDGNVLEQDDDICS